MPVQLLAMTRTNSNAEAALEKYLSVVGPLMESARAKVLSRYELSDSIVGDNHNNESINWDNSKDQIMRVVSRHRLHKLNWGSQTLVQDHETNSGSFKRIKKGGPKLDGAKAVHWREGFTAAVSYATWCLSDTSYD